MYNSGIRKDPLPSNELCTMVLTLTDALPLPSLPVCFSASLSLYTSTCVEFQGGSAANVFEDKLRTPV